MLKIRLKRVGRKNDPSYRVVVVPSTTGPKSGNVLEVLGNYDPRRDIKEVNAERVKHWMGQGAQVSDTVHNILVSTKVIDAKKINALPKKTPLKKEVVEEAPKKETPVATEETPEATPITEETAPVAEEVVPEAPVEETPAPAEEAPAQESEPAPEAPAESPVPEETPAEEPKTE